MKKSDYLQIPAVQGFVDWLSQHLDSDLLAHGYTNRRSRLSWHCNSVFDAFAQYRWGHTALPRLGCPKGSSFATNAATLEALRLDLRQALASADDTLACQAAIDVMTWGGVRAGNVRWLMANSFGLAQRLVEVRDALSADDTADPRLQAPELRFNAGMTKVYSLLCDNLIIYDSRVAAALGWVVVRYCQAQGLSRVPAELGFPWAPAKTAPGHPNPKQRNPGSGMLTFPPLRSGPLHAEWNLKASWLLEATLSSPHAQASAFRSRVAPGEQLRALEAALFMVGYDLATGDTAAPPSENWTESFTLSRHKQFHYRITPDGIDLQNRRGFEIGELAATVERLWQDFGHHPFPLANNADAVANGTAQPGLGSAYFQVTGRAAPETSKLAAIFEELGIFQRHHSTGRAMHWMLNTELLNLAQPQDRPDAASVLGRYLELEDEA